MLTCCINHTQRAFFSKWDSVGVVLTQRLLAFKLLFNYTGCGLRYVQPMHMCIGIGCYAVVIAPAAASTKTCVVL